MLAPWHWCRRSAVIQLAKHTRLIADARPFRAQDMVLLRQKNDGGATPILVGPLCPGQPIPTQPCTMTHDDIIGKRVRDVVRTPDPKSGRPGNEYLIFDVKLEDYVRMTRRLVTPIYPPDANLIVHLLDLHPSAEHLEESEHDETKLEILEAGTGHGALTLYLSRAISAANSPIPQDQQDVDALSAWKANRRAILHSVEIKEKYSTRAQRIVTNFRNGLYAPHVDFAIADVSEWVASSLEARQNVPFLSHVFLDMGGSDFHVPNVVRAMRVDGCLVMFTPSITQISECFRKIKKEGVSVYLEKVIELGVNGGSGGREWDVRLIRPRAWKEATPTEAGEESSDEPHGPETRDLLQMVCRPRVGERIQGGGFLGVFRKMRIPTQ